MSKKLIALDDGHGLSPFPTAGKRTDIISELDNRVIYENEFNREVVKYLDIDLRRCDFDTLLVAPTDEDTPLKNRVDLANSKNADAYVSIHYNAYDGKFDNYDPEGLSVHVYPNNPNDRKLAECIHKYLIQGTPQVDRGIIESNFYVLRESKCPAVLSENGFMDNKKEALRMLDVNYQKEVAVEHAKGICEFFGVEYKEGNNMEFDKAKQVVKEKAKLEDITMKYLTDYQYAEPMIISLAKAINGEVIEDVVVSPTLPVEKKSEVVYTVTKNGTHMLCGDVKDLGVKEVNKSNRIILEDNYVNSTFFWHLANGKKYSTSILYAEGITYQYYANHLPSPQSCFIIYKNNTVDMKRLYNLGELDLNKVRLVIGGVGILNKLDTTFKYDLYGEGFRGSQSDVARKTKKTMIVYNKKDDKIYLVCRDNIYHQSALHYDLIELAGDIGDIAIATDGGGSSVMVANGKNVFKGDGRVIHSIVYFN